MNLLLLLMAVGVVSTAVLNSGNGENNLEYRANGGLFSVLDLCAACFKEDSPEA